MHLTLVLDVGWLPQNVYKKATFYLSINRPDFKTSHVVRNPHEGSSRDWEVPEESAVGRERIVGVPIGVRTGVSCCVLLVAIIP